MIPLPRSHLFLSHLNIFWFFVFHEIQQDWWRWYHYRNFIVNDLHHPHYHHGSVVVVVDAYSVHDYPYIYPTQDEPVNSSWPVQDYIQKQTNYRLVKLDRPDFLYQPKSDVGRIVEYYVHWCGRCRAFKSHYIAISRRIVELAAQQNHTIEVYAISCTPNKPICMNQGIKGYPKVSYGYLQSIKRK
jgi:Thioredoxin